MIAKAAPRKTATSAPTPANSQRRQIANLQDVKLYEVTTAAFEAYAEVEGPIHEYKPESSFSIELRQFGTGNLLEFLPTPDGEPGRVEWPHDDFSGTIKRYWTEMHEQKERNHSEEFNLAGNVSELRAFFAAVTSVRDQMRAAGFEV